MTVEELKRKRKKYRKKARELTSAIEAKKADANRIGYRHYPRDDD